MAAVRSPSVLRGGSASRKARVQILSSADVSRDGHPGSRVREGRKDGWGGATESGGGVRRPGTHCGSGGGEDRRPRGRLGGRPGASHLVDGSCSRSEIRRGTV